MLDSQLYDMYIGQETPPDWLGDKGNEVQSSDEPDPKLTQSSEIDEDTPNNEGRGRNNKGQGRRAAVRARRRKLAAAIEADIVAAGEGLEDGAPSTDAPAHSGKSVSQFETGSAMATDEDGIRAKESLAQYQSGSAAAQDAPGPLVLDPTEDAADPIADPRGGDPRGDDLADDEEPEDDDLATDDRFDDDDDDDDEDDDEEEVPAVGAAAAGIAARGKGGRKGRGKGKGKREPKVIYIPPPTVGSARPRVRHWGLLLSFFLTVVAPFSIAGWYLTERAVDQYASTMGFSVRKEDASSNFEDLSTGIFGLGSQSSSDTDVLYEFIQSQDLVERVDGRLDLRSIYTKPQNDPFFALADAASVEDLVDYWQRMVTIFYDAGSGLMEVRVLAFDAQDAQSVNEAIFEESSKMINALTAIAQEDTIGNSREDLERALELLRQARVQITEFRVKNKFVTPDERIQQDNSILGVLNQTLVEAQIEQALLSENAREGDPRVRQGEQRISVIQRKINEERAKFGSGDQAYAQLVGDYESLVIDREFAESSYLSALTRFNGAVAEASRQSRYLAPHIRPTLAQSAEFPQRTVLLGLLGMILLMSWAILSMLYYSIKDRR